MLSIFKRKRSYLESEQGTTAVEFALIAVAFLTLIFGIFEGGRIFWALNTIQYAVESGARYALTNTDASTAEIETATRASINALPITDDNPTITIQTSTVNNVDIIQIDAIYTFQAIMPFLPAGWTSFDISARSRLPIPSS